MTPLISEYLSTPHVKRKIADRQAAWAEQFGEHAKFWMDPSRRGHTDVLADMAAGCAIKAAQFALGHA